MGVSPSGRLGLTINLAILIFSYLFFSALTKAVPFRLSYPMLSITLFMIVLQLFKSKEFAFNSILTKVMSILMIVSLFYTAIYFWPLRNWKYKEINLSLDENKFYFMHHDIPNYLHFDPLHFRRTLNVNQKVHCTGSFSVLNQVHREYKGKRFEYFIDFAVSNPADIIYLIPSDIYGEPFKNAFINFISAHYNIKALFIPIEGKDNQYYLELNDSTI